MSRTLVENIAHAKFTKDECTSNKRARKLVHEHECKVNTKFYELSKHPISFNSPATEQTNVN